MRKHREQAGDAFPRERVGMLNTQPVNFCGLVLAGLLGAGALMAQEPESPDPAGTDKAPSVELGTGAGLDTPVYVPFEDPHGDYLDAIDRMESDFGPYATELSDLYLGLGQSFLDSGEYEAARDAFHRGVLVVRVNSGPNSPEQTNHLYLIANLETMFGEREAADKALTNIHFINSSYYGENDPELLPVLDRLYSWFLTTRPPGTERATYQDYETVIQLTEEMVAVSENVYGPKDLTTAQAYRKLGEAHFQILRNLSDEESDLVLDSYLTAVPGSLQQDGADEISLRKHYNAGRNAFQSYIAALESNAEVSPVERAEALATLGDWNLMFEKYRSARDYYEQAYQLLADGGRGVEEADRFMAVPKPVHFMDREVFLLEELPEDSKDISLDISMTVTRLGDVRSVEILNPPPDLAENVLWKIKRHLRDTPFRPALKGGEVVTTKGFIWQFVLEPQEQTS